MKSIAIYGINGNNSGYLAEKRVIVKILGASPEAFSAQSQLQLPFMQLLVICLLTVIRDIRRDHALAAVLPHRVYEVTFSP